jgi:hypothetical protein
MSAINVLYYEFWQHIDMPKMTLPDNYTTKWVVEPTNKEVELSDSQTASDNIGLPCRVEFLTEFAAYI